ncbi:multidrug effflux MFS transporter [Aestuariispira insulae]|uniref:Bcr/CflA family efflux transporter n=1 Tax=Aestuariispira insulae TaxID=1461337 RepID=A0A3D9HW11_9PROT|nr:multidrug effflux MFS transporter [Aestuariispira insulae]RED53678.1 Bcr/CflA subfamily drug resistance transporter [Aestuariispira insulae]
MRQPASPPGMITLIGLTALSVLTLNLFLPSLSNMAADFAVEYGLMAIAIAGYLAVTALMMLVMGPVSDRFGRRPVLLFCLSVYSAASIICAMTDDFMLFLLFRLLQGVIAAGWVLSLAVIRDMLPPQEAGGRIAYMTMAMAIAPMLAPMVGGFLDEFFGWRASFYLFSGLGVVIFALVWWDLGETHLKRSNSFLQQFSSYPDLFRSRRYWGYSLCMACCTAAFYGFLAGAPLVAVDLLGLNPAEVGIYLGSITGGFAFGSFLSGRFSKRCELTSLMIAGRFVAIAGLASGLMIFSLGMGSALALFGATLFMGIGNGITMPSCNAGVMSVRPELAGSASGLAGALTVGIGALLTAFTGVIVTHETGALGLLGMMLFLTLLGLVSAVYVRSVNQQADEAAASAD